MTTETETQERVVGRLSELAMKPGTNKNGNPYKRWSFKIQERSGSTHSYSSFNDDLCSQLVAGQVYDVEFTLEPNKDPQYPPYRNIFAIEPWSDAGSAPSPQGQPPHPADAFDSIPAAADAYAQNASPATPFPSPAETPRDPTRDSIERQVALKAAVELAAADKVGTEIEPGAILFLADAFYNWLARIEPEPPTQAPERPVEQSNGDSGSLTNWEQFFDALRRHGKGTADAMKLTDGVAPQPFIDSKGMSIDGFYDWCLEQWRE